MASLKSKTFYRITNKDIYEKLESIEKHLSKLNGKVLWHTWAIGLLVLLIAAIITGSF